MRFKENYWHSNKHLENKCDVKEKISVSFRDSVGILKVSEEKAKTSSKSFHTDCTHTPKEKVISKVFQKACLIVSTQCKLFWITVQENSTKIISFHCIKHTTSVLGLLLRKDKKCVSHLKNPLI